MSELRVDPRDLAATARHLRSAVTVARTVKSSGRGLAGEVAGCGSSALAEAAADFCDAWAHGMGLVADDADGLGRALERAAQVYGETDAAVAAAATP